MFFEAFKKNHKAKAVAILLTFLGFSGLCFLIHDSGRDLTTFNHLISAVFIILIFITEYDLVRLVIKDGALSKKMLCYGAVFGFIFGTASDIGCQFTLMQMTAPGLKGKALMVLCGLLVSVLLLPFTYRIFRFAEGLYHRKDSAEKKTISPRKTFLISLAVLELFWLPAFLAYYPAVMSYDFNRQFGEAVRGYEFFYEYQPLIHTFLIRMFYLLGVRLGSPAAGFAVFSVLQSLVLASSISAGIAYTMKKRGRGSAIFWLILFALLPFNPVLAISMTKDILFSAVFAFMILIICGMTERSSTLLWILFVLTGIVNILFRNNASYALIFLIPAFLLAGKDLKLKIVTAVLSIVMIASGLGCKTLIRESMGAIPGPEMEKYSVPIVQMVRVIKYQSQNLSPEEYDILRKYVTDIEWGEYNPSIADSPKATISSYNSGAWIGEGNTFVRDYLKLAKAYPNDYFDAWVGLTIGYWYVGDRTYAEMLGYGDDTDYGMLFTFNYSGNEIVPEGIPSHSYLPSAEKMYSHIINGNAFFDWPIISLLMKPAFYFWLFILSVFIALYKRSRKSIAVLAYPLMYLGTMFLGPCVNFRYIYPFIVSLPVILSFVISEKKEVSAKSKAEVASSD